MLKVRLLSHHARLPTRGSTDAAGYDLYTPEAFDLAPGTSHVVDLLIAVEIPRGWFGKIESRSGYGFVHGVEAFGGVIDSDYRGSVKVRLNHRGEQPLRVEVGSRVAQMVLMPYAAFSIVQVRAMEPTERGEAGFGSTGGM
jgi:dUTP pyrophosphatase